MGSPVREIVYGRRTFRCPYADATPPHDHASVATLRRSVMRFGVKDEVVVDTHDNVIDGAQRLMICQEAGMRLDSLPIKVVDATPAQAVAMAVDLNRSRAKPKRVSKARDRPVAVSWSDADVEALVALLRAGVCKRYAAIALGRTRASVAYSVRALAEAKRIPPEFLEHHDPLAGHLQQAASLRRMGYHEAAEVAERAYETSVRNTSAMNDGRPRVAAVKQRMFIQVSPKDAAYSAGQLLKYTREDAGHKRLSPEWLREFGSLCTRMADEVSGAG